MFVCVFAFMSCSCILFIILCFCSSRFAFASFSFVFFLFDLLFFDLLLLELIFLYFHFLEFFWTTISLWYKEKLFNLSLFTCMCRLFMSLCSSIFSPVVSFFSSCFPVSITCVFLFLLLFCLSTTSEKKKVCGTSANKKKNNCFVTFPFCCALVHIYLFFHVCLFLKICSLLLYYSHVFLNIFLFLFSFSNVFPLLLPLNVFLFLKTLFCLIILFSSPFY